MLGDILTRFDTPPFAEETVLGFGDLNLLARNAVRRFAAEASDEDWVTLIGAVARPADPGSVCLKFAFRRRRIALVTRSGARCPVAV